MTAIANGPPLPPSLVRFAGIKACVFDAYGTLFDVNAAARALRRARDLDPRDPRLTAAVNGLEYASGRGALAAASPAAPGASVRKVKRKKKGGQRR